MSSQRIKHELSHFIVIGLFTTCCDFMIYSMGHHFMPYSLAKAISFMVGSTLAYLLHKHFTFRQKYHKAKRMFRFTIVYLISMFVNVSVNSIMIIVLTKIIFVSRLSHAGILIFAFLLATLASTILNFSGQKFWVFRHGELR